MKSEVQFREVQGIRQSWPIFNAVLLLLSLAMILIFGRGLWEQVVQGNPWSDPPISDPALIGIAMAAILPICSVTCLLWMMSLTVEVRSDHLYIHYRPLRKKSYPYSQIQKCYVRTYRPIREFGGWGIRTGFSRGWVYNVSGNRGVQLEFSDGKKLLIGSQEADQLAVAILANLETHREPEGGIALPRP